MKAPRKWSSFSAGLNEILRDMSPFIPVGWVWTCYSLGSDWIETCFLRGLAELAVATFLSVALTMIAARVLRWEDEFEVSKKPDVQISLWRRFARLAGLLVALFFITAAINR